MSELELLKRLKEFEGKPEIQDLGRTIVASNIPKDVDPYGQLEYCDNVEHEGGRQFRFDGVYPKTKKKLISILMGEVKEQAERLPTIDWNGKKYYIDQRLKELRAVDNPHDKLTFADIDEPEYSELIKQLLDMGIQLVEQGIFKDGINTSKPEEKKI